MRQSGVDHHLGAGTITSMVLVRKRATTIALDPETDTLLTRAARAQRISRSEFVRQQLGLVLEQYRSHPRPRIAGIVRRLHERGDEAELFRSRRGAPEPFSATRERFSTIWSAHRLTAFARTASPPPPAPSRAARSPPCPH